ncbi:glucose repression mediator protein [Coniosporium tulheliwenetii]|uniref:Glucose repression mediator protein n=1 Tax=Coniosporium tulheliwenetii TaxID=3383036 RepID=A0ACC2ZPB1_9PEZI|nr:glucose repression mediator protein [Cladosporium sp. JES 115]
MTSPPPEVRPIVENQVQSPGSAYPRQQYQHLPNQSGPGGIANGAPPPASALAAAEAAARERESTRTPAIPKRAWEDDNMGQKPTDEKPVRKMDVDEDYDDDGEDEKRNGMIRSGRNSPRGSANGMHHGASSVDQKA